MVSFGFGTVLRTVFRSTVGLCILGVPAHGQPPGPAVVFEREHIRLAVSAAGVRVEGLYIFVNNSSTAHHQGLFYPFPIDSLHPEVGNIMVMVEGDTVAFRRVGDGIGFFVDVPARATSSVTVSYEQAGLDSSACYILTSTTAWNRPLERAAFEIHVPGHLELEWASYDMDLVSDDRGVRIYEFVREEFMPDRDLCLRWRSRQPEPQKHEMQ